MESTKEFVTMKKAAEILGIHYQTLRRMRADGYYRELRFLKPGPNCRPKVYAESVLEAKKNNTVS